MAWDAAHEGKQLGRINAAQRLQLITGNLQVGKVLVRHTSRQLLQRGLKKLVHSAPLQLELDGANVYRIWQKMKAAYINYLHHVGEVRGALVGVL
jgi:hypothetical protein